MSRTRIFLRFLRAVVILKPDTKAAKIRGAASIYPFTKEKLNDD